MESDRENRGKAIIIMVFPEDKLDQDEMDALECFWAEEYEEMVKKLKEE